MNTKSKTSRIGVAAAIAAIALAATACGSETETASDPAGQAPAKISRPPAHLGSPDAIERAARARAEHADALRWARGHETGGHPASGHPTTRRATSDRVAEAERAARAERADALRWAHGHSIRG
jgi:hypothetical protein